MASVEKFDSIVLSGGGSNGIIILGALHYYFDIGLLQLKDIKEYAGASIGSVICLLLVCGYTPLEIFKEIQIVQDFFGIKESMNIIQNIKNMGIISIDKFIDKIQNLVVRKLGQIYSLKKLYEVTGKKLYVSATDITNIREIKYSYLSDISCLDAVKHSCNIPIIFHRIKYKNNYIVDGGVANNYPWDYLSKDCKKVLGILLCGKNSIFEDDNFLGYSQRIIITPIKLLSEIRYELSPSYVKTVKLDCEKMSYININDEQKLNSFLKGYQQTKELDQVKLLDVKGWYEEDFQENETEDLDFDFDDWNDKW
jgi:predicted acylesterase/phospholipase RssA